MMLDSIMGHYGYPFNSLFSLYVRQALEMDTFQYLINGQRKDEKKEHQRSNMHKRVHHTDSTQVSH